MAATPRTAELDAITGFLASVGLALEIRALGPHPSGLFHSDGCDGESERLAFICGSGCYPGVAGLVAAGMAPTQAGRGGRGRRAPLPGHGQMAA